MFSKFLFYISTFAIIVCLFESCDKTPEEQTVQVQFAAKVGNVGFDMGNTYSTPSGQRYKIQTLLFYVSDLRLVKDDGTEVELSDVLYYNIASPDTIIATIPTGNYTAIAFGLGLDSLKNATDPATIAPPNPLSYAIAPYWGWASKYIFAKLEGFVTADATATPNIPFLFHTGTDALYREVNIPRNIEIGKDAADISIIIDLDKLFSTPQTIDLINNGYTQTVDGFEDAERLVNNFAVAFE